MTLAQCSMLGTGTISSKTCRYELYFDMTSGHVDFVKSSC